MGKPEVVAGQTRVVNQSPRAVVTSYDRVGVLKQYTFIASMFWRLEVWN